MSNVQITTLAELEALPMYSIVELPSGQAAQMWGNGWKLFGTSTVYQPTRKDWIPATIIRLGSK